MKHSNKPPAGVRTMGNKWRDFDGRWHHLLLLLLPPLLCSATVFRRTKISVSYVQSIERLLTFSLPTSAQHRFLHLFGKNWIFYPFLTDMEVLASRIFLELLHYSAWHPFSNRKSTVRQLLYKCSKPCSKWSFFENRVQRRGRREILNQIKAKNWVWKEKAAAKLI